MKKFKLNQYHRDAILELLKRNRDLLDEVNNNDYLLLMYEKQYDLPGDPAICESCGTLAFQYDCEGIALCDTCMAALKEVKP